MTYKFIGKVNSVLKEPVIYFVTIKDFLYIGETESHPVIRWGSHLALHGTLLEKIRRIDRNLLLEDNEIEFYAFECTYIKNTFNRLRIDYALKYTEFQLHLLFKTRVNTVNKKFGREIKVISDTPNKPKFFKDSGGECEKLAVCIFDDFLNNYSL